VVAAVGTGFRRLGEGQTQTRADTRLASCECLSRLRIV